MQWLARTSVARPVFATVLILALTVLGLFSIPQLGVERYPNIDIPYVTVVTVVPGASPQEMEADVTDVIERQVNTVPGLESLTSTSFEGMSLVILQFEIDKNGDVAAQEVRAKVDLALPELPREAERPVVAKFRTDDIPVTSFALISPTADIRELTEYAKHTLRPLLQGVRGVGEVALVGGRERQINVLADAERCKSLGLTVVDVQRALAAQNAQIPGGSLERGRRRFSVRTEGRAPSVAALENLVLSTQGGRSVRLRDVASVVDGEKDPTTRANVDSVPAVLLNVRKQSGENTVAVVKAVQEKLAAATSTLPRGYRIEAVRDESVFVTASLDDVRKHLVLGSILAALVVLLFLRDWSSMLIAAIAIPTSLISTFAVMKVQGFSLNVLTLLALTLVVGIVIDDAILVVENIYRHLTEKKRPPHEAAIEATQEIGLAVLATTLSLVAVFLPVGLISGLVGRFLGSFGITMAAAILISMLVAFSLTPMLASRWLHPGGNGNHAGNGYDWLTRLENAYGGLLRWSLRHRAIVAMVAGLALLGTVPLAIVANKTFLPAEDQSQFTVTVRAPEGASLAETERILTAIATDIRQLPDVIATVVTAGEMSPNKGSVLVRMPQIRDRKAGTSQFTVMERVRSEILPRFPRDLTVAVVPIDPFGSTDASVQYILTGPDRRVLATAADRIAAGVRDMPEVSSATTNAYPGNPELKVQVDRERAADRGILLADIATTVRILVAGEKTSRFSEDGRQYDIVLRAAPGSRERDASLQAFTVPSAGGVTSLADVVRFEPGDGPSQISRYNRQKEVRVLVNPRPGASLETIQKRMEALLDEQKLPVAYSAAWEGDSKEFERTFISFGMAFALSLIFMYLVLAAQFESWVHPVTILASLPLCVPFALVPLVLTGDSLNLFSLLGMLVLFGIVKKNAILQVDHALQLIRAGEERDAALLHASRDRLRAILMTTVAFVAGMIPLAFSHDAGAATNRTIAVTVIGGQTLSLLLTLVATPVVFSLLDDLMQWASRMWKSVVARVPLKRGGAGLAVLLVLLCAGAPAQAGEGAAVSHEVRGQHAERKAGPLRITSVGEAVRVALNRNPEARIAAVRKDRARAGTDLVRAALRPQIFTSFTYTRLSSFSAFTTGLATGGLNSAAGATGSVASSASSSAALAQPRGVTRAGSEGFAGSRADAQATTDVATGTGGGSALGGVAGSGSVEPNLSIFQMGVTLPVDITGVLSVGVQIARLEEAISSLDEERARQDLALEVRSSSFGLLRSEALLAVQEAALHRAVEQLRVTQARRDEGLVPEYDVLRARTEERAARQTAIAARNQIQVTRSRLVNLLQVPSDTEFAFGTPELVSPPDLDLPRLLSVALVQRPESRVAVLSVQRADRAVRYARRGIAPSLALSLTGSYLATPSIPGYESQRASGTLGAVLTVPVSDGGATRAAVSSARLDRREAELRQQQWASGIATEVEQAAIAVRDAQERRKVADEAIAEAQAALRIANLRFASGIGTQLEVLDVQAALTRAEASVAETRYDYLLALARLSRALGDPAQ